MKNSRIITSLACHPLAGQIIKIDDFDYPVGSIDTLAGGIGWDYEQNTE